MLTSPNSPAIPSASLRDHGHPLPLSQGERGRGVYPCIDEKTDLLKIGTLIFEKQGKFFFSSKSGRGEWM
jgi:hypothetical protein